MTRSVYTALWIWLLCHPAAAQYPQNVPFGGLPEALGFGPINTKSPIDDRRVIGGYRLLPGGTPREKAFRERWKGHRNKRRGDGPRNRAAGMKPNEVEAYWR
jgi:hypothetical protein